ncbi:hypothetical protein [Leptolyngbya ohadii]|uniref:hypothetical protein n=1 Tax=Leptolyngbya ohadii TaxID=1962290 RepID=UPI0015C661FC|nr:hypothetical protein [Leptolyngbya ohadii]
MNKLPVIKRLLASLLVSIVVFGCVLVDGAVASPRSLFTPPPVYLADAPGIPEADWMVKIKDEILPKIEEILSPAQRERFETTLADGMSFRKAFKSLMLTPEQKMQISSVLKSATKKDIFAALTPEQKKQLFLKKKEMTAPTAAEITERIEASLKEKGLELPTDVKEKINAGLKRKDSFMPSAESIVEKIESSVSAIKQQFED